MGQKGKHLPPSLAQIRSEKWLHVPVSDAVRWRQEGNQFTPDTPSDDIYIRQPVHSHINRKYIIFHATESLNKGFTIATSSPRSNVTVVESSFAPLCDKNVIFLE